MVLGSRRLYRVDLLGHARARLTAGVHTWKVQTSNSAGAGPWSAAKTFFITLRSARGRPPAPSLVSPSGTITATEPTYRWWAASTATDYYLSVNGPSGNVVGEWSPHAIRFILPNSRIRNGVYVHPATHSTGAASAPSPAPPYGARFRLRSDFPLQTLPNEAARVVARALQRYGMFLADGGQVALTAGSDRFTTTKWSGLLGSRDLEAIQVSDFQMVDGGARIPYTGDCVRTQD